MVHMIMYQHGKLQQEILCEMSNPQTRKAFRLKETIINGVFNIVTFIYIVIQVFNFLIHGDILSFDKYTKSISYVLIGFRVVMLVMLLALGGVLLYYFKHRYNFAYRN